VHLAGLGADIIASAAEYRVLQDETAAKQRALEAVALVSSLHQSLQALTTQINQGHLPLAAKSMLTLQERINGLPDSRAQGQSVKAPLVFGFLKDELLARKTKLEAILDERFAKAVIVDQSRAEVRAEAALALPSRGHQPGSSAEGMWEALETLGLLDRKIEKLAEQLFSGPVTACLKSADVQMGASFLSLEEGEGTGVQRLGKAGHEVRRHSAKLKWVGGSNGNGSAPSLVEVYSQLLKVVQFLHHHVASEDRSKTLRLGTSLWPRIATAIIEGPLTSAVPIEASKLPDFASFAEASRDFEKDLEAAGFIPSSAEGHELSAFAADIDVHFASKKRTSLLARARQLVLQPDWCYKTSTVGSATEEGPSATTATTSTAETPPTAAKKVKPLGRRGGVEAPKAAAGNADATAGVSSSREASGEPQMPGPSGRGSDGAGANKGGPFFWLPTCQVSFALFGTVLKTWSVAHM
jgi:centromere/kinetochore protein ZW10